MREEEDEEAEDDDEVGPLPDDVLTSAAGGETAGANNKVLRTKRLPMSAFTAMSTQRSMVSVLFCFVLILAWICVLPFVVETVGRGVSEEREVGQPPPPIILAPHFAYFASPPFPFSPFLLSFPSPISKTIHSTIYLRVQKTSTSTSQCLFHFLSSSIFIWIVLVFKGDRRHTKLTYFQLKSRYRPHPCPTEPILSPRNLSLLARQPRHSNPLPPAPQRPQRPMQCPSPHPGPSPSACSPPGSSPASRRRPPCPACPPRCPARRAPSRSRPPAGRRPCRSPAAAAPGCRSRSAAAARWARAAPRASRRSARRTAR